MLLPTLPQSLLSRENYHTIIMKVVLSLAVICGLTDRTPPCPIVTGGCGFRNAESVVYNAGLWCKTEAGHHQALCFCETCQPGTHCQHVTCPENGYTLQCVHGQCTCTHTTSCSSRADCRGVHGCMPDDWHCVDNLCRCGQQAPQGPGFPGNHGNGK